MMEVEIRIPAYLGESVGRSNIKFSFDGDLTVYELLEELDELYGLGKHIYSKNGALIDEVRILLRGRDIRFLAEEKLKLKHGDIVLVLPMLAGG